MTIKEMHIEVSQATQNIAANVRRKLLDEEKDWLLNKNQQRFIQSKLKPKPTGAGYLIEQMDVDSIRTLIKSAELPAECIDDEYSVLLPADYAYLLSDRSRVTSTCNTSTAALSTVNETVLQLTLATTTKQAAPYYASLVLTIGQVAISMQEIADFYSEATYAGVKSKAEVFLPVDAMLWYLRNVRKMDVYWEKYRGMYKPRTFLFPGVSTGSISVDGTVRAAAAVNVSYKTYELTGDKWVANRLTASPQVVAMRDTPFLQSSYNSPLSELAGNYLIVYGDTGFIVSKVRVEYIRKPRRMSLILGQDSELPEEFHQAVCDLTAEYIKAMTADPNWEVKLKDNMLRSIPNQP